jgi:chromosome segregation ATPase
MVIFKKQFHREMEKIRGLNNHLKEETTSLKARVDILSKYADEKAEEIETLKKEVKTLNDYIKKEFETLKQGLKKDREEMLKKAQESKALFKEYLFGEENSK